MIYEMGNFWFVDGEIPEKVERAYWHYCHSIHCAKHFDHYLGKCCMESYGRGRPQDAYSIVPNNEYKHYVKEVSTAADREYEDVERIFQDRLGKLVKFVAKNGVAAQVKRDLAEIFGVAYEKAWRLGRKASGIFFSQEGGVEDRAERWFQDNVQREVSAFWRVLVDIGGDKKSRYRPDVRIKMFVHALKAMFQAGRASGLPSNVLLSWYPQKKETPMCPGCQYMVDHSPFPVDLMPTVPRGGDTPCLVWCVHKVVVEYASQEKIDERRSVLPKREEMLRELYVFIKDRKRRRMIKSIALDPWSFKKWKGLR